MVQERPAVDLVSPADAAAKLGVSDLAWPIPELPDGWDMVDLT